MSSEAISALSISILLSMCLMKRLELSSQGHMISKILGRCLPENSLTTWCSNLLEVTEILSQH